MDERQRISEFLHDDTTHIVSEIGGLRFRMLLLTSNN